MKQKYPNKVLKTIDHKELTTEFLLELFEPQIQDMGWKWCSSAAPGFGGSPDDIANELRKKVWVTWEKWQQKYFDKKEAKTALDVVKWISFSLRNRITDGQRITTKKYKQEETFSTLTATDDPETELNIDMVLQKNQTDSNTNVEGNWNEGVSFWKGELSEIQKQILDIGVRYRVAEDKEPLLRLITLCQTQIGLSPLIVVNEFKQLPCISGLNVVTHWEDEKMLERKALEKIGSEVEPAKIKKALVSRFGAKDSECKGKPFTYAKVGFKHERKLTPEEWSELLEQITGYRLLNEENINSVLDEFGLNRNIVYTLIRDIKSDNTMGVPLNFSTDLLTVKCPVKKETNKQKVETTENKPTPTSDKEKKTNKKTPKTKLEMTQQSQEEIKAQTMVFDVEGKQPDPKQTPPYKINKSEPKQTSEPDNSDKNTNKPENKQLDSKQEADKQPSETDEVETFTTRTGEVITAEDVERINNDPNANGHHREMVLEWERRPRPRRKDWDHSRMDEALDYAEAHFKEQEQKEQEVGQKDELVNVVPWSQEELEKVMTEVRDLQSLADEQAKKIEKLDKQIEEEQEKQKKIQLKKQIALQALQEKLSEVVVQRQEEEIDPREQRLAELKAQNQEDLLLISEFVQRRADIKLKAKHDHTTTVSESEYTGRGDTDGTNTDSTTNT